MAAQGVRHDIPKGDTIHDEYALARTTVYDTGLLWRYYSNKVVQGVTDFVFTTLQSQMITLLNVDYDPTANMTRLFAAATISALLNGASNQLNFATVQRIEFCIHQKLIERALNAPAHDAAKRTLQDDITFLTKFPHRVMSLVGLHTNLIKTQMQLVGYLMVFLSQILPAFRRKNLKQARLCLFLVAGFSIVQKAIIHTFNRVARVDKKAAPPLTKLFGNLSEAIAMKKGNELTQNLLPLQMDDLADEKAASTCSHIRGTADSICNFIGIRYAAFWFFTQIKSDAQAGLIDSAIMILENKSAVTNIQSARKDLAISDSPALKQILEMYLEHSSIPLCPTLLEGDIAFDNVTFRYSDNSILDKFSLTIPANHLTAIYGESGIGKSTVMKLLSGEIVPEGGSIQIGNSNIQELPRYSLPYVLQKDPQLFEGSGGEKQRAQLSHFLQAVDPPILLLDEALCGCGDLVQGILEKLKKTGKTVVHITHDKAALPFHDKVVKLTRNEIGVLCSESE